jgi:hypothetical protein
MNASWVVRDNSGQLLAQFVGDSRLEVGRKVVPQRYDAFRLHVSPSYRELFDRALSQILETRGWQIVRLRTRREHGSPAAKAMLAHAQV